MQALPEDVACLRLRIDIKAQMGDWPGVIADLDTLLRLQPDDLARLADRGALKHRVGDFAGALADYAAVFERQPDDHQTWTNYRTTKMKLREWPDAWEAALQALRLAPDDAAAYYDLACIAAQTERAATAVTHLARAIQLRPAFRVHARSDADFAPIQHDAQFVALVEADG
jgi:tetratricopeptide (TPR) repeat protein